MPPTLHLAFQTDQNYVDGLVATLCGVVNKLPRHTRVAAHVIDCGIHPDTCHRLVRLVATRQQHQRHPGREHHPHRHRHRPRGRQPRRLRHLDVFDRRRARRRR